MDIIAGVFIVLGVAGVVVPTVPGLVLSWIGRPDLGHLHQRRHHEVDHPRRSSTFLAAVDLFTKYAVPHRRLRNAGVPARSIVFGAVLGIVGFFVIPVIGLIIGFVLGVFLAEWVRLEPAQARLAVDVERVEGSWPGNASSSSSRR